MEKLGGNSVLKAKAQVNALAVLRELGLGESTASALLMNKKEELKQLINVNDNLCCVIKLPWAITLCYSYESFLYGSHNVSKLKPTLSKIA